LSALTFIEDGNKDMVVPNRGMSQSASASSLASVTQRVPPGLQLQPSNASTEPSKPLVNFFKRSLTAEILRDIQQYQFQPYNLAKCKSVFDYMMRSLEECDRTYNLERLYELSLKLEPREREEERITRMLHDSVSLCASAGRSN
jgi:son of sevenless-like protein